MLGQGSVPQTTAKVPIRAAAKGAPYRRVGERPRHFGKTSIGAKLWSWATMTYLRISGRITGPEPQSTTSGGSDAVAMTEEKTNLSNGSAR